MKTVKMNLGTPATKFKSGLASLSLCCGASSSRLVVAGGFANGYVVTQ